MNDNNAVEPNSRTSIDARLAEAIVDGAKRAETIPSRQEVRLNRLRLCFVAHGLLLLSALSHSAFGIASSFSAAVMCLICMGLPYAGLMKDDLASG